MLRASEGGKGKTLGETVNMGTSIMSQANIKGMARSKYEMQDLERDKLRKMHEKFRKDRQRRTTAEAVIEVK